jgi:hypothetical protein
METKPEKTIGQLSGTPLYRIIVVISMLLLVIFLAWWILFAFGGDIFRVDQNLTTIKCLTNDKVFTASQAGQGFTFGQDLLLPSRTLSFQMGDFNTNDAFQYFHYSYGIMNDVVREMDIMYILNKCYGEVEIVNNFGKRSNDERLNYLLDTQRFDINIVFSTNEFLTNLLIGNALITISMVFIFELIRRIYYYIISGKFNLKK